MSIYYHGGFTWKQHLQMDSYVQDINGQIKRTGEAGTQAISDQTRSLIASNEALERSFGEGFDRVNSTLEWGFDKVAGEIGAMRAEFSYGLGLLHDQMIIANDQLRGILDSLDAIHETLKHPLLTQARELSNRGLERMGRGLLPEALKDLHDSAEKNEADFVVQYHIGKLYLSGRNDTDEVIDPAKAEEHLRLAARYANSEIRQIPAAAKFCGGAYFHASIARYAQSHDRLLTDGDAEGETEHLREMLDLAGKSIAVFPENPEAFYHHAKYAAWLGEGKTCVKSLRKAIEMDRNYCLKVDADRDFDSVREEVQALLASLYDEAKAEATSTFDPIKELLEDYVFVGKRAKQAETEIQRLFQGAESFYRNDTYFDYLDALPLLRQAQETFDQIPDWDVIATLTGHTYNVNSVAFSPDGKTLASGSPDNSVKLWSVAEKREIAILTGHTEHVTSVAFSPDGKTLASGSVDKGVKLWSVAERREIATLTGHRDYVHSVAFSPDGKTLASGSYKSVKLWSVAERREIATLTGHRDYVLSVVSVAFSPDGKTLASGSRDNSVKLWSVAERREIATLTGHTSSVYSVAFSPDGKTLASGSVDKGVKLWSVAERREIATLTGHTFGVNSVAFSPDGKTLASGSCDRSVKLWSVAEKREIATLTGHTDWVYSVAFSPDGKTMASGSDDRSVKLWEKGIITRQEFEELEKRRRLAEEERRKREAEEAERQRLEEEARQKREAERLRNKQCLTCGVPLGFFAKLFGHQHCKAHRQ